MKHAIIAAVTAALLVASLALCGAMAESISTAPPEALEPEVVYRLEARLAELGYFDGQPDETVDAETRSALESFQQANGLEVTGQADDTLLERLNGADAVSRQDYLSRFSVAYAQMEALRKGSVSNDVLVMQRKLRELGFFSGEPDGEFSETTQRAVESFQMVNGLPITGVADGATLMRLMADSPITWTAFLTEMSAGEGDSGLNVYVLQKRLGQMGYFTGSCTAAYGELTAQAVRDFQADSALEVTGIADPATWAAIYSRSVASANRAAVLQIGDFGDDVVAVQNRLNALGFFDNEVTGQYGYTTESAVRLFQMANNLSATGVLNVEDQSRLMADTAASMLDSQVQQRFTTMLDAAGEQDQARIAKLARDLMGLSFGDSEDELYPGFDFVQYVCVSAGLPVTFPEDLMRMADRQVETIAGVEAGDIVAFQSASADAVSMVLAIGAGDGMVISTTESGGWVELAYMDRMQGATIYCWDAR